jgi:hypothetical protein
MPSDQRPPQRPLPPPDFAFLAESADEASEVEYRVLSEREEAQRRAAAGPTFRDDFVLGLHEDVAADANFTVLPPEGISPAERRALTADLVPVTVEEEPERPLTQFSLLELMWLMTFFAAGFSVFYYFPLAESAGVLGLLALLGQGLLMRFPPENRHVRLGAYALLMMYVVAVGASLIQYLGS